MGILKKSKEQDTPRGEAAQGGRPLLIYFLPAVLVAIVLMGAIALLAQRGIHTAASETAAKMARTVADTTAARLESEVIARRNLLRLTLADAAAGKALADGDAEALNVVEADLQKRLPGILQVRLLPTDANQPDPTGPAPLGYAGLDMLRRTVKGGRPPAAEIHQIKSGVPYLALTAPVRNGASVVGVLFSAWDLRPIIALVQQSPAFPGRLHLQQGGDGGSVLAQGPGRAKTGSSAGAVDVPESIWQIGYRVAAESGGLGDLMTMLGLIAGAGLGVLLVTLLQLRALSRDLKADMSTVVNLGEAILRRDGAGNRQPFLAGTRDAIALLCQYARDARSQPVAAALARSPSAPAQPSKPQAMSGMEVEVLEDDPADILASGGASPPKFDIPESLFGTYDIRGVVGETLSNQFAEVLGKAVGTLSQEEGGHKIAVARDARGSSADLARALIKGLQASGCDVLDLGQVPTPLMYFAMNTQSAETGVMVTGSHSPPSYNGFKIVVGETVVDGQALQDLRQRILDGRFTHGQGGVEKLDLISDYAEAVSREVQLAQPLKLVVDAGNGVAGELAIATFEMLGCEVVPLFCEPDGSYPNHQPDPSQPDNLASLILEVEAQQADMGFAFDGDGDRVGVVDNAGNVVWADRLLMLLAADVLGRHPGVDVLYDVKSSRHLASFILGHGGRPIMWKSGHSRMRAKMLETGALLGGEFSGHLFVKERWFGFDDAIYAAARIVEILALEPRGADAVFAELPSSPSTPEYHLALEPGQSGELMRALDAHKVFDDARLVELDGLRVEFTNGWGLIRPSNTMPALTFRFEADDESALEQIKERFRDLLRRVAPDMQAPF